MYNFCLHKLFGCHIIDNYNIIDSYNLKRDGFLLLSDIMTQRAGCGLTKSPHNPSQSESKTNGEHLP